MLRLHIWITFLLLQKNRVLSCPEEILVNGTKGKEVTLEIGVEKITRIDWIILPEVITIATIRPGKDPDTDLHSPLRGRLSSTSDGSLIIKPLKMGDQRRYRANVNTETGLQSVCYDLRVYEELLENDIRIIHNVTTADPCEMALTCFVEGKKFSSIMWRTTNSTDLNATENVLVVPSNNVRSIFICTACNPVSNSSKEVQPQQYCPDESAGYRDAKTRGKIFIVVSVAGIFALVLVGYTYYVCWQKQLYAWPLPKAKARETLEDLKEVSSDQKEKESNDANDVKTVYATAGYSLVATPQKDGWGKPVEKSKNSQSKVNGEVPKAVEEPVETCYATVNLPVRPIPQQNGGVKAESSISNYSEVQLPKGKNVQKQTQNMKDEIYEGVK